MLFLKMIMDIHHSYRLQRRLVMIIGLVIVIAALFQCFALPYRRRLSLGPSYEGSLVLSINTTTFFNNSNSSKITISSNLDEDVGDDDEMEEGNGEFALASDKNGHVNFNNLGKGLIRNVKSKEDSSTQAKAIVTGQLQQFEKVENLEVINGMTFGGLENKDETTPVDFPGISRNNGENMDTRSRTKDSLFPIIGSSTDIVIKALETQNMNAKPLKTIWGNLDKNSAGYVSMPKRLQIQPISISRMNSLFLQSLASSHSMRPRWSSTRDHELVYAKLKIENAPAIRNAQGLHAPAFRNVSIFVRSYELMERILKVFIYKEGEKPIFHQSKMRGIYASEGWFMKLIEGNKKFTVRNPRKAHLFYLPFSSDSLRNALFEQNLHSFKDLEKYLKDYVDLIAQKYNFWNRTGGADHFFVGCHDWASKLTKQHMQNCIRALCNANVARDFKIGKDTSLPVTYIRSVEAPLSNLGGNPASERPILAFFAGGMHGYLRPILLQYWENKEPDMKIFGPMPRDIEGKRIYSEYMKSSKYCICARGYEVHTPRVVEAIFYECVPVIISDNYMPPFFEVLNWEAFSIFVQEKDIPNLRNILLSIPEKKYLEMQLTVKMVQQHFLWHKKPVKYDLFHMILHSVWYNRVFQMKSK